MYYILHSDKCRGLKKEVLQRDELFEGNYALFKQALKLTKLIKKLNKFEGKRLSESRAGSKFVAKSKLR